ENQGEKRFRAKQIWHWLYEKRITDFQEMKNVNQSCIALLEENFTIFSLEVELKQESKDGTIKFLFKLHDGQLIETVLMRHNYGFAFLRNKQSGLYYCCLFCANCILSKKRDSSAGQKGEKIKERKKFLEKWEKEERVSHIVVMGIGEPFDNFDNLVVFLKN